jgi:hypothetical protein
MQAAALHEKSFPDSAEVGGLEFQSGVRVWMPAVTCTSVMALPSKFLGLHLTVSAYNREIRLAV